MDFGEALKELKNGKKVAREGWNGKGMWIASMPALYLDKDVINGRTKKHIGENKDLDSQPYIAWYFYYSEEQEEMENFVHAEPTYVEINGEWKQYTECAHERHTRRSDYKPHKDSFEDSKLLGRVNNPEIKKGSHL
jgi:hypothetical protein